VKPEIPPELHKLATHPALPAIPGVVFEGKDPLSQAMRYRLIPPSGGHTLLDLYFCTFAGNLWLELRSDMDLTEFTDENLDAATRLAWRLAISAVRTRPDTSEVPSGLPNGGLR
jgi:hypothetical protein